MLWQLLQLQMWERKIQYLIQQTSESEFCDLEQFLKYLQSLSSTEILLFMIFSLLECSAWFHKWTLLKEHVGAKSDLKTCWFRICWKIMRNSSILINKRMKSTIKMMKLMIKDIFLHQVDDISMKIDRDLMPLWLLTVAMQGSCILFYCSKI